MTTSQAALAPNTDAPTATMAASAAVVPAYLAMTPGPKAAASLRVTAIHTTQARGTSATAAAVQPAN
jgi:hypothetical protein